MLIEESFSSVMYSPGGTFQTGRILPLYVFVEFLKYWKIYKIIWVRK